MDASSAMWRGQPKKVHLLLAAATASCVLLQSCRSDAPKGLGAPVEPIRFEVSRDFSGELACAIASDLRDVRDPSERSDWLAETRTELRETLGRIGAGVSEIRIAKTVTGTRADGAAEDVHLVGVLPGASADRFLLAAAYGPSTAEPGRPASTSDGAVGLVLEVARVMAERDERPYTLMILLVDASAATGDVDTGSESARRLAGELSERGAFDRIRVAAFFAALGGHDPRVARDLYSHPVYRDAFFEAAAALGRTDAFPSDAPFASVAGAHRAFLERGLPRVVAIASDDDESVDGTCSAAGLAAVGAVTVEALDRIAERLARIDRFHASPLEAPIGRPPAVERPAPGSSASPPAGDEAAAATGDPGDAGVPAGRPQPAP